MVYFHANFVTFCTATICDREARVIDGSATCSYNSDQTPVYGDTCTFKCNSGFELDGASSKNQECNVQGKWSSGGNVNCKSEFLSNCNLYLQSIKNKATLPADWYFTSKDFASGVTCGQIIPPLHGSLSSCTRGNSHESQCFFECNSGFAFPDLTLVKTFQCKANKLWSGNPPSCIGEYLGEAKTDAKNKYRYF